MSTLNIFPIPIGFQNDRRMVPVSVQFLPCLNEGDVWSGDPIEDWPSWLESTTFAIQLFDHSGNPLTDKIQEGDDFVRQASTNSDLWKSLFNGDRVSIANTPEPTLSASSLLKNREVAVDRVSFDTDITHRAQQRLYGLKTMQHVLSAYLELGDSDLTTLSVAGDDSVRALQTSIAELVIAAEHAVEESSVAFENFYAPLSRPMPRSALQSLVVNSELLPFSAALNSVSRHRKLAAALGLSVDFLFALPTDAPPVGVCRVEPVSGRFAAHNFSAFSTAYSRSHTGWFPADKEGSQSAILRFRDPNDPSADPFKIQLHDVDATQFKLATSTGASTQIAPTSPDDTSPTLPALRSYGVSIVENQALDKFNDDDERSRSIDAQCGGQKYPEDIVFANDLIAGYRFDVTTSEGTQSTYNRTLWIDPTGEKEYSSRPNDDGSWPFPSGWLDLGSEEGFTERASSIGVNEDRQLVEAIHEMICHWDGWSMTAPLPTRTKSAQPSDNKLFSAFEAPVDGSLPRLRFGQEYVVSCRAVFLNNVGLNIQAATTLQAHEGDPYFSSEPFRFKRSGPIAPPHACFDESSQSDENVQVVTVGKDGELNSQDTRWIYPPKTDIPTIDASGVLDSLSPQSEYDLLSLRSEYEPPIDGDSDRIKYLPDPWATYARVEFHLLSRRHQSIPHTTESNGDVALATQRNFEHSLRVPFYGRKDSWPNARPFRIRTKTISKGPTKIRHRSEPKAGATLRIDLAPGDQVEIRVFGVSQNGRNYRPSATRGESRWLISDWISDLYRTSGLRALGTPAALLNEISNYIDSTENHPLVTSKTSITARHAIPKPLNMPSVSKAVAVRRKGETSTHVLGQVFADGASIDEVGVVAEWTDIVDKVGILGVATEPGTAESTLVGLDINQQSVGLTNHNCELQLGDTRHRRLKCRAFGHSRFSDLFESNVSMRGYSEEFEVIAPNVGVPESPEIRFVVPVFQWERARSRIGQLRSGRLGHIFRVYIERPWFSTGEGEQIGVVCWPDAMRELDDTTRNDLRPYVCQWGMDPLWKSKPMPNGPFADHFVGGAVPKHGVRVLEFDDPDLDLSIYSDRRVTIVPYDVHYDETKDLWYADIEMKSTESYLPWLKLALVRYQPTSIDGMHISTVAPTLFTQLMPNRMASISSNRVDSNLINLTVSGPSSDGGILDGSTQYVGAPSMTVQLQRNAQGDDLSWISHGSTIELKRTGDLGSGGWSGSFRLDIEDWNEYRLEIRESIPFHQDETNIHGDEVEGPAVRTTYIEHIPLGVLMAKGRLRNGRRSAA